MASIRWEVPALVVVGVIGIGAVVQGVKSFELDRAHAADGTYARQRLFDAVQPVNVTNCTLARVGNAHDGGYLVCENLLGNVKTAYSYGISGEDGWGCDVSRRLGVGVHEYDCFDLRQPACPGGRLIFHPECVGTTRTVEDGRPFDSLAGQFERNGDSGNRLLVKIDVEGAEWPAFQQAPDSVFEHIDQLVVEFHRTEDSMTYPRIIERLKRFFVVAHVHYNNYACDARLKPLPAWAIEVLLVNRRLARTDGRPGAAPPTALDAPNSPSLADCQS
jgi:hypothetical protein